MKKIRNFVIGGIDNKVFNLVLFTLLAIILVYNIILVHQADRLSELAGEANEAQQASMEKISDATMQNVLNATMSDTAQMQAQLADDMFREVKNDVRMLADYATKLYADPEAYMSISMQQPEDFSVEGNVLTWLHAEDVDTASEEFVKETELLGNMGGMLLALLDNSDYLGACYVATADGVTLMCDDATASLESAEMGYVFDSRQRPWYIGADRTGSRYFTGVERDYYTDRIGIVCSVPVYKDGKLVAVAGGDLFLDTMEEAIQDSDSASGFTYIVDSKGHVIFSPQKEGAFRVQTSGEAQDLRQSEYKNLSEVVSTAISGTSGIYEVDCGEEGVYYMAGAPIETVSWAVIIAVDKEVTRQPAREMQELHQAITEGATQSYRLGINRTRKQILIALVIISAAALLNAIVLSKRIVKPLNRLTKRIVSLTGENPAFEMSGEYRTGDEIQVLAESFADLSMRTREYMAENMRITAEKERIGAELNVATRIQADMLPRIFPPFPERKEFDLYASMQPAKAVGGDFYDFFLVDEDHLAMVMADVSDKGVPAALFMVITKTLIKNRAQMGDSPAQILENVNRQLCENNDSGLFVTIWLAILTISTGKGLAANAGHEHPALRRAGGPFELIEYRHNLPLALMAEVPYTEHSFELHPGDSLFVYTDGVTEASTKDKKMFGEAGLITVLNEVADAHPKQVLERVREKIAEFTGDADQFDDMTMLCMKYYG